MIRDFGLEDRHVEHRAAVREFCETEIRPEIDEHEETGRFPESLLRRVGEAGLVGVPFDEGIGGEGADYRTFAVTVEEVARTWKLIAGGINIACGLVGYPIDRWGADWQRERWLGRICRGEWIPAFALTEPEAGSDAASIETTARLDGEEWVLDGRKVWTTHGSVADFVSVVARVPTTESDAPESDATNSDATDSNETNSDVTDGAPAKREGIALIGVPEPADRSGFEVVRDIPCMEGEAAVESELSFDGLRVPADHVVGEVGRGLRYVLEGLDVGRLGTAAQGVGIATGAYEASREFAGEREQFGQPIREFQGVGFPIADMATRVSAARLLTHAAADAKDRGERITAEAAMAKTFATDVAMDVATEAVQVHGARGYSRDYPVERYMREAKGTQIYDGTNEINRVVLLDRLYGGS